MNAAETVLEAAELGHIVRPETRANPYFFRVRCSCGYLSTWTATETQMRVTAGWHLREAIKAADRSVDGLAPRRVARPVQPDPVVESRQRHG